jgi:hypothetical protein
MRRSLSPLIALIGHEVGPGVGYRVAASSNSADPNIKIATTGALRIQIRTRIFSHELRQQGKLHAKLSWVVSYTVARCFAVRGSLEKSW